jgi:sorbitol/mannitol transport system substrate-binding protein
VHRSNNVPRWTVKKSIDQTIAANHAGKGRMMTIKTLLLLAGMGASSVAAAQSSITVAVVNNPDMVTMQKLSGEFGKLHPNVKVSFVTLPENELRQKVTTDIATSAGQYDVVMLSNYETPIWAKNGWLLAMNPPADYDVNDLLPTVRAGLSFNGKIYALPFYAESSMTYYRKDLFAAAKLTMPAEPTWTQIGQFAAKLTDKSKGTYGICLRGLPGWGENMAVFDTMVNAYGGRWFDMNWKPELTSAPWKAAANQYKTLVTQYGPPGATSNGFTESETLFANGQCAMWVDATVAAGYLADPKTSKVAANVGFAQAPHEVTKNGSHWLYAWSLAIPKSSRHAADAQTFIDWATSKGYIATVAKASGWIAVPPGTRQSTYANPEYLKVAPFAKLVEQAIATADPSKPSVQQVPYIGIQFVDIPEFQAIGTRVGQIMAGILVGQTSVDQGLQLAQTFTLRMMMQSGKTK